MQGIGSVLKSPTCGILNETVETKFFKGKKFMPDRTFNNPSLDQQHQDTGATDIFRGDTTRNDEHSQKFFST
jgi:hypothetical protein